jgi:hypothetical protein
MVVLGEKLCDRPVDRSVGVLGIMLRTLFLRSSRVRPTLLMARERLPRTWTGVGSVRVVCIGFFPVGCTSIQIIVTLGYE